MAESGGKSKAGDDPVALAPLGTLVAGLLFLWTASALALRNLDVAEGIRQIFPLLLWTGAIALWIAWQRPARPLEWLGIRPLRRGAIGLALLALVLVLAWNVIRVLFDRMPGELLAYIPPIIYLWMAAGVFLNELLFRGVVQTRLAELHGPVVAIFGAAALTVLFRVPSLFAGAAVLPFDPLALVNVFVFASLAGALRHFGRSLWPAVASQMANAFGALL